MLNNITVPTIITANTINKFKTLPKIFPNLSLLSYQGVEKNNKDEVLDKLISYYDFVFTNFSVDTNMYYIYNENLDIDDGKSLEDLNIPQNLSEEPQNVIVRLEKIGLMYVLDGKIYNPNAKSIDTMKVRLVL